MASEGDKGAAGAPTGALWSGLGEEGWRTLLSYTESLRFQAGDVVLRSGGRDRSLCLVTEGELEVLVPDTVRGERRRIARIDEGSVVGEQSFLDGQPRSADIRALRAGRMRVLSFVAFEELCAADPRLAVALLLDLGKVVSQRLRDTTAFVRRLLDEAPERDGPPDDSPAGVA